MVKRRMPKGVQVETPMVAQVGPATFLWCCFVLTILCSALQGQQCLLQVTSVCEGKRPCIYFAGRRQHVSETRPRLMHIRVASSNAVKKEHPDTVDVRKWFRWFEDHKVLVTQEKGDSAKTVVAKLKELRPAVEYMLPMPS